VDQLELVGFISFSEFFSREEFPIEHGLSGSDYPEYMHMSIPDDSNSLCLAFLDLLDHWNKTHALTSLPKEARFEELILDSWVLVPHLSDLPAGARVVDFGSGMGIPAVVLAIARPDLEIIALDKSRKKIAFVRQVALELKLSALKPLLGKAEEISSLNASMGVAKAVGSIPLLAGWWERHGLAGAPFLALKGESWGQEPGLGDGWTLTSHPYHLPTRGDRMILKIQKKQGSMLEP
jgi:16S rRNA (guanine527-N7)-methyltransferase